MIDAINNKDMQSDSGILFVLHFKSARAEWEMSFWTRCNCTFNDVKTVSANSGSARAYIPFDRT